MTIQLASILTSNPRSVNSFMRLPNISLFSLEPELG
jgi:hypothetical protein